MAYVREPVLAGREFGETVSLHRFWIFGGMLMSVPSKPCLDLWGICADFVCKFAHITSSRCAPIGFLSIYHVEYTTEFSKIK